MIPHVEKQFAVLCQPHKRRSQRFSILPTRQNVTETDLHAQELAIP
jgi:hypothetical protein